MNDQSLILRSTIRTAEWQQRVDLAACYRLVAMFGWDDLIFTHISARVPGPEHHFLINPYGMLFSEITASSLVKIDLDGRKVFDSETTLTRPDSLFIARCTRHARMPHAYCMCTA